jgi:site-specific recombinase XerD
MSGSERKPGRLGPYVEGYRDRLLELGYTPLSVSSYSLVALGQLGRWMASEDVAVDQLDSRSIKAFLATRRTKDHRPAATASLVPLLDYLRDEGVTPLEPARALAPLDGLIGEYRDWLIVDRALAPETVRHRQQFARRFLEERMTPEDHLGVKNLTSAAVTAFLLRECERLKLSSVECYSRGLRSLLRFPHVRGYMARALADCVPSVASWRDAGIPKMFPRVDIERLLQSCERSSLSGARDFAILSLLARLGLRAVEVSRLRLGDLYWRAGEIEVDGKAHRRDRLPLPSDVGEALVDYLSLRERRDTGRVFLTLHAPIRPIEPTGVRTVVREACRRAGLEPVGAHRLRHALASEMLRQDASLLDISQVLRHKDLTTTAIYAKVDFARLREVAQPWPGVGR